MTGKLKRPGIDGFDTGSYEEPRLTAHRVLRADASGLFVVDGAPTFDWERINLAPALCKEHALALAIDIGFTGPRYTRIAWASMYQSAWVPYIEMREQALWYEPRPRRTPSHVAVYSYGRAYFEPGEPRSLPCSECGSETLLKSEHYED